jgi:phosphopantothenoylcysteine decarboxylase/phosphopantothenate--cysteine ligase
MFKLCENKFQDCDIAICAAAVSDFKPLKFVDQKIKTKSPVIKTRLNTDIIKELGKKKKNQFLHFYQFWHFY